VRDHRRARAAALTKLRNLRVGEAHLRRTLLSAAGQGERPRHVLLAALRERIGSVLLATQSFWEGSTSPARRCRWW